MVLKATDYIDTERESYLNGLISLQGFATL